MGSELPAQINEGSSSNDGFQNIIVANLSRQSSCEMRGTLMCRGTGEISAPDINKQRN